MGVKAPAVLIVDDNTEFADLLGTLVAEQGLTPIVAHTAHNALTLARLYTPQAIVVDLLLPDMTGHKLIKDLSRPSGPPIFVMTGVFKGPAQLEKVRAVARVAGWFEKPFDTRVLVEEISRQIGRTVVSRVEHHKVGQVTPEFDIQILDPVEADGIRDEAPKVAPRAEVAAGGEADLEIDIDVEEDLEGDGEGIALWDVVESATPARPMGRAPAVGEGGPGARLEVEVSLRADEGATTADEEVVGSFELTADLEKKGEAEDPAPKKPLGWLESQLPPVDLEHMPGTGSGSGSLGLGSITNPFLDRLQPAGAPPDRISITAEQVKAGLRAKMRAGNLKPPTVGRLLTAFHLAQETGEIAFERGAERKVVYLAEGRAVYARSNQDSDRLGAIAKKAFGLTSEAIERALAIARSGERMIGDVLLEEKLIDEARRPELVREQTRAIIRSLLTWTEGRYVIGFNVRAEIEHAELDEHPAQLVMSGVREELDLPRLRALVPDRLYPMPSPNPPYELYELPLGDPEALLVLRATGLRTVAELLAEVGPRLSEQAGRALIHALLVLGVLVAGRGTAPPKRRA